MSVVDGLGAPQCALEFAGFCGRPSSHPRPAGRMVTVGIALAGHPPYRSLACGFLALGSCLRSNAQALIGIGVCDSREREPTVFQAAHYGPRDPGLLASPP